MPANPYAKGITNFKDILATKYDKPFENISESEIKNDMVSRGFSRNDVRDVVQGFRKFKRKDAEFTFQDGGFRINTTEGALKGSGRRKGRTVGQSSLARMLDLGEDVSKFAQFADNIAREVNVPDVVEPDISTIQDSDIDLGDFLNIDPNVKGPPIPTTSIPRGGGKGGGAPRTKTEEVEEEEKIFMDRDILGIRARERVDEEDGIFDNITKKYEDITEPIGHAISKRIYEAFYRHTGIPYDVFRKQEAANRQKAEEFGIPYVRGGTPTIDIATPLEDMTGLTTENIPFVGETLDNLLKNVGPGGIKGGAGLTPDNIGKALKQTPKIFKGLKDIYQAGKSKIKNLLPKSAAAQRQAQRQAINAENVAAQSKAAREAAHTAKEAAHTAKVQPPVKQFSKGAFKPKATTPSEASSTTIKEIISKNKPAIQNLTEKISTRLTQSQVNREIAALAKAGRKKGSLSDGTQIRIGKGGVWQIYAEGGKLSNGKSELTSEFAVNENSVASVDPAFGKYVWQDQKDDSPLQFSREYYNAFEGEGVPVKSPRTSDDTSLLAYMKRGGKMPKLANGGPVETAAKYRDLFGGRYTESGLLEQGEDAPVSRTDGLFDIERLDPTKSRLGPGDMPDITGIDTSGYNPATTHSTENSEFGDVFQAGGLGDEDGRGVKLNDLLYGAAVYGTPAAKAIAEQISGNKLKKTMYPDLRSPELQVGAVRDIRRPDFSTPYNVATADLGRENLNRQFQLAQSEQSEKAFEIAQDESKIRQEEGIRENLNKQAMIDADIGNRAESIRANIDANRYMRSIGVRDQAILGGAESVATGATQREGIDSYKRTELAKAMIRSGDVKGGLALMKRRGRRLGGKLSKYSNG